MSRGEPGLPARFTWGGNEYAVAEVLHVWKTSSRGACGDNYLRRHWYEVLTTAGVRMTLYCDRQARDRKHPKRRWWVYTVDDGLPAPAPSVTGPSPARTC